MSAPQYHHGQIVDVAVPWDSLKACAGMVLAVSWDAKACTWRYDIMTTGGARLTALEDRVSVRRERRGDRRVW